MKYIGWPLENFHIPWGFRWFLGLIPIVLIGLPLWVLTLGAVKTPLVARDWLQYCGSKSVEQEKAYG